MQYIWSIDFIHALSEYIIDLRIYYVCCLINKTWYHQLKKDKYIVRLIKYNYVSDIGIIKHPDDRTGVIHNTVKLLTCTVNFFLGKPTMLNTDRTKPDSICYYYNNPNVYTITVLSRNIVEEYLFKKKRDIIYIRTRVTSSSCTMYPGVLVKNGRYYLIPGDIVFKIFLNNNNILPVNNKDLPDWMNISKELIYS